MLGGYVLASSFFDSKCINRFQFAKESNEKLLKGSSKFVATTRM